MFSGILNDVNQSLSVVLGYLDLAGRALDQAGIDLARQRILLAACAARTAAASTDEVLSGACGSAHDLEPIDVSRMVHEVAQLTAPHWGAYAQTDGRTIAVRVETDPDLVALGASHWLRSALMNCVLDAIDRLPTGGKIVLRAQRAVERAEIDVGWSATLWAEPERRFRFSLPTAFEPPRSLRDLDAGPTASLRVLVVDDSASMRELMLLVLRQAGYDAHAAGSAAAALARLEAATFDVVISDLWLGNGINGWGLAWTIAEHWPGVGFVLATDCADDLKREQLQASGVDAVLSKPFRVADLRDIVLRVAMGHSSMVAE